MPLCLVLAHVGLVGLPVFVVSNVKHFLTCLEKEKLHAPDDVIWKYRKSSKLHEV